MADKKLFHEADYYKSLINQKGTFSKQQKKELDSALKIEFIYSSSYLEGNALSYEDTKMLLIDGITASGKPVKECYEVSGQAQAFDYMLDLGNAQQLKITEDIIKRLHYLYYYRVNIDEAGQYRKTDEVKSYGKIKTAKAEELAHLMEHLSNQILSSQRFMHPIELAAMGHKRLIDISPFREGNGIIARLIMNLILLHAGYGVTSISPNKGDEYINALALSQRDINPNIDPLIDLIAESVVSSLKEGYKFKAKL